MTGWGKAPETTVSINTNTELSGQDIDPALKAEAEERVRALAAAIKNLPREDLLTLASAKAEGEV
jgi:hypothetical protein